MLGTQENPIAPLINALQHQVYENIFSLGDCSNLPTSKTAAAITAQHTIVSENIENFFEGKQLRSDYDGYTRIGYKSYSLPLSSTFLCG